jgi:hypothetical protein
MYSENPLETILIGTPQEQHNDGTYNWPEGGATIENTLFRNLFYSAPMVSGCIS